MYDKMVTLKDDNTFDLYLSDIIRKASRMSSDEFAEVILEVPTIDVFCSENVVNTAKLVSALKFLVTKYGFTCELPDWWFDNRLRLEEPVLMFDEDRKDATFLILFAQDEFRFHNVYWDTRGFETPADYAKHERWLGMNHPFYVQVRNNIFDRIIRFFKILLNLY